MIEICLPNSELNMAYHIHIQGQVQGVGFRPYVWRLARAFGLTGWVNNTTDGVHIAFEADAEKAVLFYNELISNPPPLARIASHVMHETGTAHFPEFSIVESEHNGQASLMLTPDFRLCADCRRELHDPQNRRFGYAFLTCTHCGPRYSIAQKLPYDRIHTTMQAFAMCDECGAEYQNPEDRRFYSQTNSCAACGIQMQVYANGKIVYFKNEKPAAFVAQQLTQGRIVAVKGIGGYLLLCDATNPTAVQRMRVRKHRPAKPFAVMYPDMHLLKTSAEVSILEEEALLSPVAPIVLLNLKNNSSEEDKTPALATNEIAPGLSQIGVMLPYAPLLDWIAAEVGIPLVATSGNVSNSPIVYTDEKAILELSGIADFILTHNRPIAVPQDDSVIRFSTFTRQKIVIRRSRGLAPNLNHGGNTSVSMLAMGADMKSTFALTHQTNTYVSQYLGDLESYETQQNYEHTLTHFLQLLEAQPNVILTDRHPGFFATQLGNALEKRLDVSVQRVQHHQAHFAAVLGENSLIASELPVLGVIWDGTGLGDDGHIWGGEFFSYDNFRFQRCCHFDYFDFLLGDKMPKEPRISALTATFDVPFAEEFVRPKFTDAEWKVYAHLLQKRTSLQTSSVGRIFDGVASLLGLIDQATYEGEAAMLLENLAKGYCIKNGLELKQSYFPDTLPDHRIPTKLLMQHIVSDLKKGLAPDCIAAKFHYSLVHLVQMVAKKLNINQLAFSGGVFQNEVLVDLLNRHLSADFRLFFHRDLSPNDENISFGQLMYCQIEQTQHAAKRTEKQLVENSIF